MGNRSLPTDAELSILRVLWRRGPLTVREVHDELKPVQDTGYTTVLKLMQIMAQKGILLRDESSKSHIYHAQIEEEQAQRGLMRDLLDKAFDGSASRLVMRALSDERASASDLAEIRALLDEMERRGGKP
jgi:BlaI family transcriptional regulator, penicillinase repressor